MSRDERGDKATKPSKIAVFAAGLRSFWLRYDFVCETAAGGMRYDGGVEARVSRSRATRCSGQSGRLRFQASYSARTRRYGEGGHSQTPSLTWRPHGVA
jgi:hypothetical protein